MDDRQIFDNKLDFNDLAWIIVEEAQGEGIIFWGRGRLIMIERRRESKNGTE